MIQIASTGHTSEATKKVLRDIDLHTAVISGVCTKFVQAHIRCYYETWISNGDRMTFTTGGNLRARSMEVYLDWIVRAWDALPKNQVISPFRGAWPYPEGLEMLKEARAMETAAEVSEEEDVEEDLANSYLSVEDEVIEEEILFEFNSPVGGSVATLQVSKGPLRSPDLTPCDFFLWDYIKSKVYTSPVTSLEELRERIENAFRQMPQQMVNRSIESYERRQNWIAENEDTIGSLKKDEADVSLITGKMRFTQVEDVCNSTSDDNKKQLVNYSAGDYFANRTWKGLDDEVCEENETSLKTGLSGVAASYASEKES
uniref:Uncharacterized protein n=1 Tax=Ditylenchus dipsaci TaxID=166011 RepID=A0A915DHE0_9BILA